MADPLVDLIEKLDSLNKGNVTKSGIGEDNSSGYHYNLKSNQALTSNGLVVDLKGHLAAAATDIYSFSFEPLVHGAYISLTLGVA